jgi:uncharacterized damage-inducible protein DinB
MAHAVAMPGSEFGRSLLETYAVNERMNQLILEQLDPHTWRAKAPGRNARTIAAIFAHMHNIRHKWVRLSAPHIKLPPRLDRICLTQQQARVALAASARSCSQMLAEALCRPEGRVKQFRRDGWAKAWPAGAAMFAYMIVHESHHRGQICMLAHLLGCPLPSKTRYEMWVWEKLWKQCGFAGPR